MSLDMAVYAAEDLLERQEDDLLSMWQSVGWQHFVSWVSDEHERFKVSLVNSDVSDVADFARVQGQARALRRVLEWEETMRARFAAHRKHQEETNG